VKIERPSGTLRLKPPAKGEYPMSNIDYTTLVGYLAEIPDPRSPRGQRYEWRYLLLLIAAAMLTGASTPTTISNWVAMHQVTLIAALQPVRKTVPSMATLRRALCAAPIEALEAALGRYQAQLAGETGDAGLLVTKQGEMLRGAALDGKVVRGASAHGEAVHLVSLVCHESGIVLDQMKASHKRHKCRVAAIILARRNLDGVVLTMDALHTSVKQARQIRQGAGDYLFVVKRNRRTLYNDIADAFTVLPPQGSCEVEFWKYAADTVDYHGHGRTEHFTLESTPALNHYLAFPDVAQVVRRTRQALDHRTGRTAVSAEFLITSPDRDRVTLAQLEQVRRWRWTIENVNHYLRDVSFGEDRCQVRAGNAPQALAALRNAIAALLHVAGWPFLPNGFRYCQRSPQVPLQLIGGLAT
jgi:predicted transposase YbfD/YdcC